MDEGLNTTVGSDEELVLTRKSVVYIEDWEMNILV